MNTLRLVATVLVVELPVGVRVRGSVVGVVGTRVHLRFVGAAR